MLKFLMPGIFQGANKRSPYFEGWYYKAQLPDGRVFAFIPGISLNRANPHSFIQVLRSDGGSSEYFQFSRDDFKYSENKLEINIGESTFTENGLDVKTGKISAKIDFVDPVSFSRGKYTAGIMGPFAFVPFLECRHAVITVKSVLEGYIKTKSEYIDVSGGSGYIEKDWGNAFPNPYIWIESCNFPGGDSSFMLSVARVPVFGLGIAGFIAFLYFGNRLVKFTTYNFSRIKKLAFDGKNLEIAVNSAVYELLISAVPQNGIVLKAPVKSGMTREVTENSNCWLSVELKTHGGKTVFHGETCNASVEISGDISQLFR